MTDVFIVNILRFVICSFVKSSYIFTDGFLHSRTLFCLKERKMDSHNNFFYRELFIDIYWDTFFNINAKPDWITQIWTMYFILSWLIYCPLVLYIDFLFNLTLYIPQVEMECVVLVTWSMMNQDIIVKAMVSISVKDTQPVRWTGSTLFIDFVLLNIVLPFLKCINNFL